MWWNSHSNDARLNINQIWSNTQPKLTRPKWHTILSRRYDKPWRVKQYYHCNSIFVLRKERLLFVAKYVMRVIVRNVCEWGRRWTQACAGDGVRGLFVIVEWGDMWSYWHPPSCTFNLSWLDEAYVASKPTSCHMDKTKLLLKWTIITSMGSIYQPPFF